MYIGMLQNLMYVCWEQNEAIEMDVCKLSVGLKTQKFSKTMSFEKLELHLAIAPCDSYTSLILCNLLCASMMEWMHAATTNQLLFFLDEHCYKRS